MDDTDFGYIKPIRVIECLGGDYTPINVGCQLETAATTSPVYGSLFSNVRAFFFPRRLLATVYGGEDIGHLPAVFNPEGATDENAVQYLKFIPFAIQEKSDTIGYSVFSGVLPARNSLLNCLGFPVGFDFLAQTLDASGDSVFGEDIGVEDGRPDTAIASAIDKSPYTAASIVMYFDMIYNYYSNHHAGYFPIRVCYSGPDYSSPVGYSWVYVPIANLSNWLIAIKTGRVAAVSADLRLFDRDGTYLSDYDLFPKTYQFAIKDSRAFVWSHRDIQGFESAGDSVGLSLCTFSPDINTAWISDSEYSTWLSKAKIAVKNNEVAYEDIITASSFYREAAKFAFGDGTFEDFYAAVNGVRSRPSATVSQYLGGFSRRVDFQSIRQTAATNEGSLADVGGYAANAMAGHIVNFYAEEPGYLMICHTLVPDLCYSRGVESYLLKTKTDDFYSPNFANIGYQPRRLVEVDAVSPNLHNIFYSGVGFQPAWTEYTTTVSRSLGSMDYGGSLSGWTFQAPAVQAAAAQGFMTRATYCHPEDFNNIFMVNRPTNHNFYMQYGFNVKSRRIIPKRNMPKLML